MRLILFLLFPVFLSAQINRAYGVIEIGASFPNSSTTGPKFAYRTVDSSFYRWVSGNTWVKVIEPSIVPDTLYLKQLSGTTALVDGDTIDISTYLLKTDTTYFLNPYIRLAGYGLLKTLHTLTVDTSLVSTKTYTNRFLLKSDTTTAFASYLKRPVGWGLSLLSGKYPFVDSSKVASRYYAGTNPTTIASGYLATSNGNNLVARNLFDNNTYVGILNSKPFALGQWTTPGRPTGVTGYEGYNTTGNGKEWYQGSRWAYALESTFARGTAGSIFFADVNGQVTQDNSNLFWDDPNNRLGIRTTSPLTALANYTTDVVDLNGRGVATNGILWRTTEVDKYPIVIESNQADGFGMGMLIKVNIADTDVRRKLFRVTNQNGTIYAELNPNSGWRVSTTTIGPASGALTTINASQITLASASTMAHTSGTGFVFSPFGISNAFTIRQNTGRIGILNTNPSYALDVTSTDAFRIPAGTTAQTPTENNGIIRYNSDSTAYQGYAGGSRIYFASRAYARSLINNGAANPSATIGLTAINGSSVKFMRSDAAPALSQAIRPTWTDRHRFADTAWFDGNLDLDYNSKIRIGGISSDYSYGVRLESGGTMLHSATYLYLGFSNGAGTVTTSKPYYFDNNGRFHLSTTNTNSGSSTMMINGRALIGYDVTTAIPSNSLAVGGTIGVNTLSAGQELDVNGDGYIRDSLRVGTKPNMTTATDIAVYDANGWLGYRTLSSLADGNGIYTGSGTLASHTTRAAIPSTGNLLFTQKYNSNADSAYIQVINGLDGNREVRLGLTDTMSTGSATLVLRQDADNEVMAWDLRSSDGSGATRLTGDGGNISATVDEGFEIQLSGMVRAKREAYHEITSTSSPQTLSSTYSDNLINQGGTQATFTLNMPASPEDGQICTITFNNAITTLTIDGNGETIVGSAVVTGVPGSQRKFKFYTGIGWIKLY